MTRNFDQVKRLVEEQSITSPRQLRARGMALGLTPRELALLLELMTEVRERRVFL